MITGITTAPRIGKSQLKQSYQTIIDSGFPAPWVFAEPDSDLRGIPKDRVIQRKERLGCWQNYRQSLVDLLELDPDAKTICLFQDDIQLAPRCREWLDQFLWPSDRGGLVSLYSPEYPGFEINTPIGFNRYRKEHLYGALAYVFKRAFVERLVTYTNWRGRSPKHVWIDNPVDKKAADAWVGEVAKIEGFSVYYPNPSLCQHIAEVSSIGNHPTDEKRGGFRYRMSGAFDPNKSPFDIFTLPEYRYDENGKMFMRNRGVAAVMPAWNCFDLTEKAINALALQKETFDPLELVYVDNGSESGIVDQVKSLCESLGLKHHIIAFPENRGFTEAVNAGMRYAQDKHILLLNNDCYMHDGCLRNMMRHLMTEPKYASVGPITNDEGAQSFRKYPHLKRYMNKRMSLPSRILSGFCQIKRYEAIQEIGLLDTALPHGLGTDDDWCRRGEQLGWKHAIACDAIADHDHKSTFRRSGQNRQDYSRHAHQYLKEKAQTQATAQ